MMERTSEALARPRRVSRRLFFVVPGIVFAGVALNFGLGLRRDPSELPSALLGKPVPNFALQPVQGRRLGLATENLKGEVSLVNVFASWCTACRVEHPVLLQLKEKGVVPVHAINYKDKPDDAARWLDDLGDPYTRTGADIDGRVAIDWGVYGVPETYVVDRAGRIAYKQVGPITQQVLDVPLIARLRQ
jgi:cytochrome c biogenesis protein CcmG/thiol:disulfide interchange protein DsbE